MPIFTKRPIPIQARLLYDRRPGGLSVMRDIEHWCGGTLVFPNGYATRPHLLIDTLEGTMRADIGDYVIQGINGEFYPCKPHIFAATYEPAE